MTPRLSGHQKIPDATKVQNVSFALSVIVNTYNKSGNVEGWVLYSHLGALEARKIE